MIPPVSKADNSGKENAATNKTRRELGTAPIKKSTGSLVDAEHNGHENQDGDGLKDDAAHVAEDMPEAVEAKEAETAARVGRELGFYCREVRSIGKPDRAKVCGIIGRMCVASVDTVDDVLALVMTVRTTLAGMLTAELADEEPTLWTEFYALQTLLDKAAGRLELEASEPAGDFDGSTPTAH